MQNPTLLLAALLTTHLAAQQLPRTEAKDEGTQTVVLSVSGMT